MSVPGPSVKPFAILSLCLLVTSVRARPGHDRDDRRSGHRQDRECRRRRTRRRQEPRDRLHQRDHGRGRWLLPAAAAAGRPVHASPSARRRFATLVRAPIQVNVSQTVRLNAQLELRSLAETVTVTGGAQLVDTSTNALGRIVTGRELVDLPLNGRNFTQLGLLQTGVAPLTAGVVTAGGSLRQGQAYAVNGMRPEQNMYLVDGAQNVNRMDGGYALKLPVEAIAEFRILTQSAPPEYGGTGGATTSVVTRSGGNQFHGNLYEFLRNDHVRRAQLLLRGSRAAEAEPVRRHGRRPDHEGQAALLRLLRGLPQRAGHDDDRHGADRAGARRGTSPAWERRCINFAAGGVPIPGNKIPEAAINPVARNVRQSLSARATCPPPSIGRRSSATTSSIRPAAALDFNVSPNDQIFGRYSYSGGHNINPISVRGTDVPGFPTRDDLSTHAATLSSTHIFSPSLTNPVRGDVPAARVLLRPAPQSDAAERARLRLHLVERGRSGAAVLQRQRLHADRRRHHRTAQHEAEHLRSAGRPDVDEGVAPDEGRRRDPADRHRHGSGDRTECVLRLRRNVSDQQRDGEPAAGGPGDVLPGPRRLRPPGQRLGRSASTRRTSGASVRVSR